MKVRLDKTTPTDCDGEFRQEWTIDDRKVVTEAEWGNVKVVEGCGFTGVVAGTVVNLGNAIATIISCGYGPVDDGEEYTLDANWLKNIEMSGVELEHLIHPIM